MNNITKRWNIIVIVILAVFSLSKCTQSCSRQTIINNKELTIYEKDSLLKVANDSINILNTKIQIYEERISGLTNSLTIQEEAARRISEAKKNISVTVKERK